MVVLKANGRETPWPLQRYFPNRQYQIIKHLPHCQALSLDRQMFNVDHMINVFILTIYDACKVMLIPTSSSLWGNDFLSICGLASQESYIFEYILHTHIHFFRVLLWGVRFGSFFRICYTRNYEFECLQYWQHILKCFKDVWLPWCIEMINFFN